MVSKLEPTANADGDVCLPQQVNQPTARASIWQARDWVGSEVGYVVSRVGDPDRPTALVLIDQAEASDQVLEHAHAVAAEILEDEAVIDRTVSPREHLCVMDLRPYGRADSPLPTPAFLYSLMLQPVTAEQWKPAKHAPTIKPRPYCRFLHQRLNELATSTIAPEPADQVWMDETKTRPVRVGSIIIDDGPTTGRAVHVQGGWALYVPYVMGSKDLPLSAQRCDAVKVVDDVVPSR